jgi:hypothetical protein
MDKKFSKTQFSKKYFVQPYLEVAKPVSLNFHGNKGEEMIATGEVGDGDALINWEVGHTME